MDPIKCRNFVISGGTAGFAAVTILTQVDTEITIFALKAEIDNSRVSVELEDDGSVTSFPFNIVVKDCIVEHVDEPSPGMVRIKLGVENMNKQARAILPTGRKI